jgi:hypothetical protein
MVNFGIGESESVGCTTTFKIPLEDYESNIQLRLYIELVQITFFQGSHQKNPKPTTWIIRMERYALIWGTHFPNAFLAEF